MDVLNANWLSSIEGESLVHHFYISTQKKRRFYGILERPPLPPSIEEVTYKIFMIGRSGVGKTSVVSRLAGTTESRHYTETNGIKKTNVFWPVKIWDKIVLFKLQFWDTSETSIKKYNHILPACKDSIDAVCSVFSFDDATTFNDIPYLMNTMSTIKEKPANIVIGTKFKTWMNSMVEDEQDLIFGPSWI
ncbi:hypothetical protein KM043_011500 [Ampulex compressa]|nr:hypothetical protein KM043_011500 [Ampulex compressa]